MLSWVTTLWTLTAVSANNDTLFSSLLRVTTLQYVKSLMQGDLLGQSCWSVKSSVVVGVQPNVPGDLGCTDPPLGVLDQQPRDEVLGLAGDVTPVILWEHEFSILNDY